MTTWEEAKKISYVYDWETYLNYSCVTFKPCDRGRVRKFFIDSSNNSQAKDLETFLESIEGYLIGFNNESFDDLITLTFLSNQKSKKPKKDICKHLFDSAQAIINFQNDSNNLIRKSFFLEARKYKVGFKSFDLKKVGNIQKSLKLIGVSLQWNRIQDLPYPFDKELNEDEKINVLEYNLNDVNITYELMVNLEEEIKLRFDLSKQYEIDMINQSRSGMANKLFIKFYENKSGLNRSEFLNLRTNRNYIQGSNLILPCVSFNSKSLNNVKNEISNWNLKFPNYTTSYPKIKYGNNVYQLGVGGLHSEDSGNVFESDNKYMLIDADVSSYYPSIMINYNIYPSHLGNHFLEILKDIKDERMIAKKEGNKIKSEGLKIVINSVFGKLGFENFFLYDPLAMRQVTINGQLMLLMLIERLVNKGFEVISANTDGIVSKIERNRHEEFLSICKEWEKELNFELEYTEYKKYVRRDVNNYIVQKVDGKIKAKGIFNKEIDLTKGYDKPIISIALEKYFIEGLDMESILKNHTNIYDFCSSQKMGSQFKANYDGQEVQNSLRYYVSQKGKNLIKVKKNGSSTSLCAGRNVSLFNDYFESMDYAIDYSYYKQEIESIVREVKKGNVRKLF